MAEEKQEVTFKAPGIYWGRVTGKRYHYREGQTVIVPKGEFRTLKDHRYETRPVRPQEPSEYELGEHKGAGYYYVRRGGERVTEGGEPVTVGQGKDAAREQIEEMNQNL